VAGYIPRWLNSLQEVTHPSTNQARRRVTSLIKTSALPLSSLSQTATHNVDLNYHTPNVEKVVKTTLSSLASVLGSL